MTATVTNNITFEKKRKIKIQRTLKASGVAFSIISALFILWVVISWIDVATHNLEAGAVENMLVWNFFVVCFNSTDKVDFGMIFNVALVVEIGMSIILSSARLKRIFTMQMLVILTLLSILSGNNLLWLLIIGLVASIVIEVAYINNKK